VVRNRHRRDANPAQIGRLSLANKLHDFVDISSATGEPLKN
jgi:hypothetical protein